MKFRVRRIQLAPQRKQALTDAVVAECDGNGLGSEVDPKSADVIVAHPTGPAARVGFDEEGFIERVETPLGRKYHYEPDKEGRLAATTNPAGYKVGLEYADFGGISRLTGDDQELCRLEYDDEQRLKQISHPDNTTTRIEYDEVGNVSKLEDRCERASTFEYDSTRLAALTDPNGNRTTFEYGEWDLPDRTKLPDGRVESYGYDDEGRLATLEGGTGPSVAIDYDAAGIPASFKYADDQSVQFRYDDDGRVLEATNEAGTLLFEYDGDGRVLREARGEDVVEYSYDDTGALCAMKYPGGEMVEFAYDDDGRLSVVTDWNEGIHRISYDADDLGSQIESPNGLVTRIGQTADGLPTKFETKNGRSSAFSQHLRYDVLGRLTSTTDSEFGTSSFEYDAEGQLIAEQRTEDERVEYGYDQNGNRILAGDRRASFDSTNQLTNSAGVDFHHDSQGNLTSHAGPNGRWALNYDRRGHLVHAAGPKGKSIYYRYDAFGRRIAKEFENTETRFYWAGEHLIAEATYVDGELVSHREYLYRPKTFAPLAMRVDKKVYVCHTDQLGVPRRLSDDRGKTIWKGEFSAFGEVLRSEGDLAPALALPGQYRDVDTGLCYNRFRYFSPNLGRFISADPLRFIAGPNFYTYCGNNPLTRADPLGFWSLKGVWESAVDVASTVATAVSAVFMAPAYALAAAGGTIASLASGESLSDSLSAGLDSAGWLAGQTKGFFKGVLYGVGDMVGGIVSLAHGLYNVSMIRACYDPKGWLQSVNNLGNAVKDIATNPGKIVDAIVEPITDAWGKGNYGEAIGRAFVEVADVIVGTKGIGKASKAGKLAKTARVADDLGDAGSAANKLDDWKGPADYSDIVDHKSVGPGKPFTQTQKRKIRERNMEHNGDQLRSDLDGTPLDPPVQSKKGVPANMKQAEIDHIHPKSKGGANSASNAQVLSKEQNLKKSDK